jgi:hypothetical protein
MHDDRLEGRLRSALRTEADGLSFTITAEELQRRLAIRRRARLGRPGVLLLAATVGIGLVGVGLVAGGWLERPQPNPSPIPSAPIADASHETPTPSNLPLPPSLPSIEAFLAPLDPARIVRAQSVGPSTAPTAWSHGLTGPGATDFGPVTSDGSYRVYLTCLGNAQLTLRSAPADTATPPNDIPITCDGSTTARDVGLAAGDALAILASEPTSWRLALLAPERPGPHATSIAADVTAAAGKRLDAQAQSDASTPVFGSPDASPAPAVLAMHLGIRDSFRIAVSCAGSGPLTYALRPTENVTPTVGAGEVLVNVATTVECDGGTHLDVVRFPFVIGADVWISAPTGTAWRIAAAFEDPPIDTAPDGDGWTIGIGLGPNLWLSPQDPVDVGQMSFKTASRVRIVVTCLGGSGVDVSLRDLDSGAETTGTAACVAGSPTTTIIPVEAPGRRFELRTTRDGAMWLAVNLQQEKAPGSGR